MILEIKISSQSHNLINKVSENASCEQNLYENAYRIIEYEYQSETLIGMNKVI